MESGASDRKRAKSTRYERLSGGALVLMETFVPGALPRHRLGEVAHLIVALVAASVHRQKLAAILALATNCPRNRARHVLNVDKWAPRRAVAENSDLARRYGAGDEVIKHQIEPQPVRHAAGSGEAERGEQHVIAIKLGKGLLGADFRAGIGGERVGRSLSLRAPPSA